LLTPALARAAAISSSDAVFAETFVLDAAGLVVAPAVSELVEVGAITVEGAVPPGVFVEPPHAGRTRTSMAAAQAQPNRVVVGMMSPIGMVPEQLQTPHERPDDTPISTDVVQTADFVRERPVHSKVISLYDHSP
jgi:hypothetical protein